MYLFDRDHFGACNFEMFSTKPRPQRPRPRPSPRQVTKPRRSINDTCEASGPCNKKTRHNPSCPSPSQLNEAIQGMELYCAYVALPCMGQASKTNTCKHWAVTTHCTVFQQAADCSACNTRRCAQTWPTNDQTDSHGLQVATTAALGDAGAYGRCVSL